MFQYKHPARIKWKTTLVRTMDAALEGSHADAVLVFILAEALQAWLNVRPSCFDRSSQLAGARWGQYASIVQTQEGLGWEQLWRGRLVRHWSAHQTAHLRRIKQGAPWCTRDMFAAKVVQTI